MTTTKTKIGRQKFAAYAPDETATALRSKHKANTCVIPLSGRNEMLRDPQAASRTQKMNTTRKPFSEKFRIL